MGNIYVAARYSRRNEMRSVASHLRACGHHVTSRWLTEDKPLDTKLGDDSPLFYATTARIDLDDIDKADTLMFFSEDPLVGTPRGGRHVEFGYALGKGKRVIVIGGPENIFHYLGRVTHFKSLEAFAESEVAA
jgi:hypothetical protein